MGNVGRDGRLAPDYIDTRHGRYVGNSLSYMERTFVGGRNRDSPDDGSIENERGFTWSYDRPVRLSASEYGGRSLDDFVGGSARPRGFGSLRGGSGDSSSSSFAGRESYGGRRRVCQFPLKAEQLLTRLRTQIMPMDQTMARVLQQTMIDKASLPPSLSIPGAVLVTATAPRTMTIMILLHTELIVPANRAVRRDLVAVTGMVPAAKLAQPGRAIPRAIVAVTGMVGTVKLVRSNRETSRAMGTGTGILPEGKDLIAGARHMVALCIRAEVC